MTLPDISRTFFLTKMLCSWSSCAHWKLTWICWKRKNHKYEGDLLKKPVNANIYWRLQFQLHYSEKQNLCYVISFFNQKINFKIHKNPAYYLLFFIAHANISVAATNNSRVAERRKTLTLQSIDIFLAVRYPYQFGIYILQFIKNFELFIQPSSVHF